MLNKIFSWFEHRLNPYPDQSPKTPDKGLFRFIWSSIEGMKGWILLLAVLTIGNGVKVGANAVVVKDVPCGTVAIGVPARLLPKPERDTRDRDLIVDPNYFFDEPALYI